MDFLISNSRCTSGDEDNKNSCSDSDLRTGLFKGRCNEFDFARIRFSCQGNIENSANWILFIYHIISNEFPNLILTKELFCRWSIWHYNHSINYLHPSCVFSGHSSCFENVLHEKSKSNIWWLHNRQVKLLIFYRP